MAENTPVEKIVKSRIVHKHDSEANWNNVPTFIPKNGEFIVYDKDSTHDYARLKMGDGITTIKNLPFISVSEAELTTILNNLQNQISRSNVQISETQPTFACTWFRPTSTT